MKTQSKQILEKLFVPLWLMFPMKTNTCLTNMKSPDNQAIHTFYCYLKFLFYLNG